MRVAVYTEDYQPLTVLDLREGDIEAIRRSRGDTVELAFSNSARYEVVTSQQAIRPIQRFTATLTVEGLQWSNGRTDPIVVIHGRETSDALLGREMRQLHEAVYELLRMTISRSRNGRPPERTTYEEAAALSGVAMANMFRDEITRFTIPPAFEPRPRGPRRYPFPTPAVTAADPLDDL